MWYWRDDDDILCTDTAPRGCGTGGTMISYVQTLLLEDVVLEGFLCTGTAPRGCGTGGTMIISYVQALLL